MALDDDDLEKKKRSKSIEMEDEDETETDRLLDQLERKMRQDKESLSELVDALTEEDEEEEMDGEEDDIPPPPLPSSLTAERNKDDEFFNYKEFKERMSESPKLDRFINRDKGGKKTLGMVVGSLIGIVVAIAAFIFFVVKLSDTGSDQAVAVKRDETPTKVRPESPGGMEIAGTDKRVYERLAPGEGTPERVKTVSPDMPVRPQGQGRDQIGDLVGKIEGQDDAQSAPQFGAQEQAQQSAIYTPKTVREARTAQTAPQARMPQASAAADGIWKVQLIALKSDEAARKSWQDLVRRVPELGNYRPEVMRVDLPDKGTVYRLRATGFASKTDATNFCEAFKRRGGSCFVVK